MKTQVEMTKLFSQISLHKSCLPDMYERPESPISLKLISSNFGTQNKLDTTKESTSTIIFQQPIDQASWRPKWTPHIMNETADPIATRITN
ncbi:hypothetical protein CDL15_Pgr003235 [Punica granatum]|uniref:Uncharacterized protein n=1 Tax=Punica granatum TaxID=22663 RepID=A0A218X2A4_PUNGR|nr:hypothetical protein CDL15_Pgr003235 [Punica granatum]